MGTQRLHSRPFARANEANMCKRRVGKHSHGAAKSINFPYKMPLSRPTDGAVAGKMADSRGIEGDKSRGATHPRSRQSGFAAGMAAANNNHIKIVFHVTMHSPIIARRMLGARASGPPAATPIICGGVSFQAAKLVRAGRPRSQNWGPGVRYLFHGGIYRRNNRRRRGLMRRCSICCDCRRV